MRVEGVAARARQPPACSVGAHCLADEAGTARPSPCLKAWQRRPGSSKRAPLAERAGNRPRPCGPARLPPFSSRAQAHVACPQHRVCPPAADVRQAPESLQPMYSPASVTPARAASARLLSMAPPPSWTPPPAPRHQTRSSPAPWRPPRSRNSPGTCVATGRGRTGRRAREGGGYQPLLLAMLCRGPLLHPPASQPGRTAFQPCLLPAPSCPAPPPPCKGLAQAHLMR